MRKIVLTVMLLIATFGFVFAAGSQEASAPASAVRQELGDEYYTNTPGERTFTIPTTGVGLTTSTTVKADSAYSLACMVKNATNPYMVKMLEGAKKAADDLGCEMVTLGPTKADNIEEQVRIVEDLIQKGVEGFILHPSDSNGIMPAVRKATQQNIPIATIGTPAAEPTFLRSGVDYYQTGIIVAERVAKELGGKGNVIILEGAPGAQNGQERLQGIKEAFAKYDGITIIASQTANWNRVQAMQVMENLLQRFDNVDAVIGNNDEMAIGAIQALKAAGMAGEVVVAGFDANQDACMAIKNGEMLVSYNTDPFGSAYLATVYLVQYLNDGSLPPRYFIPFPDKQENPIIDKSNIDNYMANLAWWL
jgi:ABC-type sugar transport system substrate-binding protein